MKTPNKTKGTTLFLTLVAFFMLSTSSTKSLTPKETQRASGEGSITVCHNGHNLTVNTSQVGMHLRHGDRIGGCLADTR